MIKVTLKDGSVKEFESPVSYAEIAKPISPKLLEKATCAKANGRIHDLRDIADKDVEVEILTFDRPGRQKNILAHIKPHYGTGHFEIYSGCKTYNRTGC